MKNKSNILIVLILVLAGLYWYFSSSGSKLTVYENQKIGISFSYPETWGDVKENPEFGCLGKSDPNCVNLVLKFSDRNDEVLWASASKEFMTDPNPRGGSMSDTLFITSQEKIDNFCADKDAKVCTVYKNSNGITVAKYNESAGYDENRGNYPAAIYYYIKAPGSLNFPGLSFTTLPEIEDQSDLVIESLRFTDNR